MITAKLVERLEVYIPVDNATEDTSPAFTTVSNPTAIGSSFGVRYKWRLEIAPAGACLISCVLKFAARSNAGQHNLRILQAIRLHQRIKRSGILRSDTHAAMRDGFAEILHFIAAVDGMTILHKENRMRHRGVVPLLAIPDLVHRGRSISS